MLDMIYSRSPDSYLLRHIEEVLSKHRVTISREILHDLSFDIPYTAGIDRSKIQRA